MSVFTHTHIFNNMYLLYTCMQMCLFFSTVNNSMISINLLLLLFYVFIILFLINNSTVQQMSEDLRFVFLCTSKFVSLDMSHSLIGPEFHLQIEQMGEIIPIRSINYVMFTLMKIEKMFLWHNKLNHKSCGLTQQTLVT